MPAKIATQQECMRARKDLVHRENELARMAQDVARAMQEMPMMKISKDYVFTRPDGRNVCLPNLFEGKGQLVVYHFTASPETPDACARCTFLTERSSDARGPDSENTAVCAVSRGPVEDISAFIDLAGLRIPFYASTSPEFGRDMHAMMTGQDGTAAHDHRRHHHELKAKGPMGKGARLSKSIMDDLMDDLLDGAKETDEDVDEKGRRMGRSHRETGEDQAGVSVFCKGADGAVYHRYSYSADMASTLGLLEMAPIGVDV
ncbi:hypothetical protein RB595_010602 [Gaeumannomyces hyphopodioides]